MMRDQPKSEIINSIIEKNNYRSYLEIGYQNGWNFDNIKCKLKTSVDPYPNRVCPELVIKTSDDFFSSNNKTFDIILIDGLHHADQVRKDIINASKCLSFNGCIVLHDLLPQSKEASQREVCPGAWNGDCWRAMVGFFKRYPKSSFITHNTDFGVGVLFPKGKVYKGEFEDMGMDWEYFNKNKNRLLNVV